MNQSISKTYKDPKPDDPVHGPNPEPVPGVGFLSSIWHKCKQSMRELADGQIGRAMRKLLSIGHTDVSQPGTRANILSKYPERLPNSMDLQCPATSPDEVPDISLDLIESTLFGKAKLTASGQSQWSFGDMQAMFRESKKPNSHPALASFPQNSVIFANLIAQGRFDNSEANRRLFTDLRGVPIAKDEKLVETRPVGIADAWLELTTSALLRTEIIKILITKVCSELDFCMGTSGGSEAAVHTLRGLLALNPNFIAIDVDIWNAFNSIYRQHILNVIHDMPQLGPLIRMLYGHGPTQVDFSSKGSTLEVMQKVGVAQGEALSMLLFAAAFTKILRLTEAQVPLGSYMFRFADGVFIVGDTDPSFAIVDKVINALASSKSGMRLSAPKCKVIIRSSVPVIAASVATALAAPRGFQVVSGSIICGSPVGDAAFCRSEMKKIVDKAIHTIDEVVTLSTSENAPTSLTVQGAQLLSLIHI